MVCSCVLGAKERFLCMDCSMDLPETLYWKRPYNPMADRFNAILERYRRDDEPMDYAFAAGYLFYHAENPYKAIPQALKYGGNVAAGRYFAERFGRALAGEKHFADVDAVIPVPLHWWRKWRRGYNQAEVIAAALAKELGAKPFPRALVRGRRTRSQTTLSSSERLSNVEGAFRMKQLPSGTAPSHILLVDDTFTTGATLAACYRAVRAALGSGVRISVATLAVVDN